MKSQIITFLIAFLLLGCKNEKKTIFYPSKGTFKNKQTIQMNDMSSEEIIRRYERFDYSNENDTLYSFSLESKINRKEVAMFPRSLGLIKSKNILRISKDSISAGYTKSFGFEKLDEILEKFYLNNGKDGNFSDSPEKAILMIEPSVYKEKEGLENRLQRIVDSFDNLNSKVEVKLELYIVLAVPIPKPPPPTL